MGRHIIAKSDLVGFQPRSTLCGHAGNGVQRRIDMVTDATEKRVWYVFIRQHTEVYAGPDLDVAISLYNES